MSEVCYNAVCWFKVEVMSITEYALNNRALMKFFIAVLVGGGIFAFLSMSKLEESGNQCKTGNGSYCLSGGFGS